jgi:outer membrane protein OmpA-like peptidoglycan-associated protein
MPILFATDSADVLPEGRQLLQNIARALANPELRQYRFRIEGHTDSAGSVEHNRDLSWRRAVSVMHYLQESAGIEARRLEPVGYGPDRPAVPRPPGTAEPRNRRVQLVNIGS